MTQGPVLYVSAEDDMATLRRRLADVARDMAIPLSRLKYLTLQPLLGPQTVMWTADHSNEVRPTSNWRRLVRLVEATKPRAVILDHLGYMFSGNELAKGQAMQTIGLCRGLAKRVGTAILPVLHPSANGKADRSGSYGNLGWANAARSRIYFERILVDKTEPDEDARVLRTTKANYGPTGNEVRVRWTQGVFVLDSSATPGSTLRAARTQEADALFLTLLAEQPRESAPAPIRRRPRLPRA